MPLSDALIERFTIEALARAMEVSEQRRKLRALDRLRVLRDDHMYLLRARAVKWFETETAKQVIPRLPYYPNPLAQVAQLVGTVYAFGATRRARQGGGQWQDLLGRYRDEWEIDIDEVMGGANEIVLVANEAVVFVGWNADLGRPVARVAGPDRYTIIAHPDAPTVPIAFAYEQVPRDAFAGIDAPTYRDYEYGTVSTVSTVAGVPASNRRWIAWNESWWQVYDSAKRPIGERVAHGLGLLPIIVCHRARPTAGIWDETSGEDLLDASITCPVLASLLIELAQTQTHLQLAIAAEFEKLPGTFRIGPAEVMPLPGGAVPHVLNLQADPGVIIKQLEWHIDVAMSRRGIPRKAWTIGWDASSGAHLEIQMEPLRALRDEQVPRWRRYDMRLQQIIARLHGVQAAGFETDFGAAPSVLEEDKRLDIAERKLRMGLMSRADVARMWDPELTDGEAEAKIERNLAANAAYLEALASRNLPADPQQPAFTPQDNGSRGPMMRGRDLPTKPPQTDRSRGAGRVTTAREAR